MYSEFFKTLTKDEFFQGCLEKDMLGYPVMTAKEILEDEQLKARGMWQEVEHEELGDKITYPSFFTHLFFPGLRFLASRSAHRGT